MPWLGPLKARHPRGGRRGHARCWASASGHQLIAAALGGTVERNPRGQTVGLQPVGWTEHAAGDDWVAGRSGAEVAIHWNNDVVVALPEGAVVLARTPGGEVQVGPLRPARVGHPGAPGGRRRSS